MKRITIIVFALLMSVSMMAGGVRKSRINGILSEFKGCEGVELVRLGPVSISAIRTVARISTAGDPDAGQALAVMGGVRRLAILDYEDSSEQTRREITGKLDRALKDADLLMEAKDGDDVMKMYGVVDEKTGDVRDFVLYAPGDCSLICVFGKVSMKAIEKLMQQEAEDND